ncbi:MAG: L-threonylcarbamoyladenylate synthase [Desulfurococcaceae archaeon]
MTIILRTDPLNPDHNVLKYAAEVLRKDGVVAFPTETVYGLGAIVFNEKAVSKVFWAKKRPPDNPLIIHISDYVMLDKIAINIPEKAYRLMRAFWPGPLTLILPRHQSVPGIVTSGLDTIAVRMPAHPIALGIIKEVNEPIAAPSANIAGKPSPTSAEHVIRDLYGRVDLIIDGGETLYGVESTIINVLGDPPILLRPGAYPVEVIEKVLGERIAIPDFAKGFREAEKAIAPGMKYIHYAPDTPIVLVDPVSGDIEKLVTTLREISTLCKEQGLNVCVVSTKETLAIQFQALRDMLVFDIGSRENFFEITRNLFKVLRRLDESKCDIAIIEGVSERGLGLAIMNRLRKAAKKRVIV